MVPFWGRCTTHFSLFSGDSLGVWDFDARPFQPSNTCQGDGIAGQHLAREVPLDQHRQIPGHAALRDVLGHLLDLHLLACGKRREPAAATCCHNETMHKTRHPSLVLVLRKGAGADVAAQVASG